MNLMSTGKFSNRAVFFPSTCFPSFSMYWFKVRPSYSPPVSLLSPAGWVESSQLSATLSKSQGLWYTSRSLVPPHR